MSKFVRWKHYGFTHIVNETKPPPENWMGGWTLCGNWWHTVSDFRLGSWLTKAEKKQGLKPGDLDPRLLAPSDDDDGKRPLCGQCKKISEAKN